MPPAKPLLLARIADLLTDATHGYPQLPPLPVSYLPLSEFVVRIRAAPLICVPPQGSHRSRTCHRVVHCGPNTFVGNDYTIHSKIDGVVKFKKTFKEKSVYVVEKEEVEYDRKADTRKNRRLAKCAIRTPAEHLHVSLLFYRYPPRATAAAQ
eukprot:1185669-Prorocentrum_minimum.AAC.1